MRAGPPPHRASVNAVGVELRHAGMIGKRAHFLVTGLAGDAVPNHQRMPRPGAPLPRLVGSTEKDHRKRSRGGRQVSRAGVCADEEIGSLQERGRLCDRQTAGPVAKPVVGLEMLGQGNIVDSPDDRPPASLWRGTVRSGPSRTGRPALGGVSRSEMHGQDGRERRKSTGVQPVRLIVDRFEHGDGRGSLHRAHAATPN